MRVYHANILLFVVAYASLAADTAIQLVHSDHLCSVKLMYKDHFGKEAQVPCETITQTLLAADLVLLCLIPLWVLICDALHRFAMESASENPQ